MLHIEGIPVVQFEPWSNKTLFRTLILADLLSGLGESAALVATFNALSHKTDNVSTILEIGTQALESYGRSTAFLFLSGPPNEAWKLMEKTQDISLPSGSALHFHVNDNKKVSPMLKNYSK